MNVLLLAGVAASLAALFGALYMWMRQDGADRPVPAPVEAPASRIP